MVENKGIFDAISDAISDGIEATVDEAKDVYLRNNDIIQALEKTNPTEIGAILNAKEADVKALFEKSVLNTKSSFGPNVLKVQAKDPQGFQSLADKFGVTRGDTTTLSGAIQKLHNVNELGVKSGNTVQQPATEPAQVTAEPAQNLEPDVQPVAQQPATEPAQSSKPAVEPAPVALAQPSALEAGRAFIDDIVKDTDAINQESAERSFTNGGYIKEDIDLMESIGEAVIKNPDIKSDLLLVKHGNKDAFSRVMSDHPEVMRAVIPIAAASDPGGMGENAMNAMGTKLKEGLADKNGVIPDDMKDAVADIDKFVDKMKKNPEAMEYLGNQLADIETSGQLLENIDKLAAAAGSPERMKMVMDDMAKNPTEVMDMMASPMMMAYAQQRYFDNIVGKMGLNTNDLQKNISEMAGSEGAKKLESLTGIDMKGMLGKLSKNLPGLENQMQGFMQHYGSMASMNMLSANATSSWMGGFGGGDMSMGGDMLKGLMSNFKSFGTGIGISNYAQVCMTDGTGNVRVKEYDNWVKGQKDMIADYKCVDEKTGRVTTVKQTEQTAQATQPKPEINNDGGAIATKQNTPSLNVVDV